MRFMYYNLDENKNPIPCEQVEDVDWSADTKRVDYDIIHVDGADVAVSTVFLNLDHNIYDEGPPLLFETMIFGGIHDEYQERCTTWDQAVAQHNRAVQLVKDSINDKE